MSVHEHIDLALTCSACGADLTPTREQLEALRRYGNPLRRQPCLETPDGFHCLASSDRRILMRAGLLELLERTLRSVKPVSEMRRALIWADEYLEALDDEGARVVRRKIVAALAASPEDELVALARRAEQAEAREAELREAVCDYFRAVDDTSWGPEKDWHKRHDKSRAEDRLRAFAASPEGGEDG